MITLLHPNDIDNLNLKIFDLVRSSNAKGDIDCLGFLKSANFKGSKISKFSNSYTITLWGLISAIAVEIFDAVYK